MTRETLRNSQISVHDNNLRRKKQHSPRDDDPQNASLSGNFQAILEFRIDSGNQTLQHHLKTASRNVTYISKTIQNEMITTVGAIIVNNLSREIMSDEAA